MHLSRIFRSSPCFSLYISVANTVHPANRFSPSLASPSKESQYQTMWCSWCDVECWLTIICILLPVVVPRSVLASYKYGSTSKWNTAINCKSVWMWRHQLIWPIAANCTSLVISFINTVYPASGVSSSLEKYEYWETVPDLFDVPDEAWCGICESPGSSVWLCRLVMMGPDLVRLWIRAIIDWSWAQGSFSYVNAGAGPSMAHALTSSVLGVFM